MFIYVCACARVFFFKYDVCCLPARPQAEEGSTAPALHSPQDCIELIARVIVGSLPHALAVGRNCWR